MTRSHGEILASVRVLGDEALVLYRLGAAMIAALYRLESAYSVRYEASVPGDLEHIGGIRCASLEAAIRDRIVSDAADGAAIELVAPCCNVKTLFPDDARHGDVVTCPLCTAELAVRNNIGGVELEVSRRHAA